MKTGFLIQDAPRMYGAPRVVLDLVVGLCRGGNVDVEVLLIEELRLGSYESPLLAALEREGIAHRSLPVGSAFSRSLLQDVRCHVQDAGIDIVHTIGPKATVHGYLALRGSKAPLVSTMHGWLFRPDIKERLHEWLELQALKRFSRVIVLSRHYERLLTSKGIEKDRVVRIPTGFAADPGVPMKGHDVFTVGMMGRLSSEKNHGMLLEAARILKEQGVTARFLVAGDGSERDAIAARVRSMGLEESVELLGYVSPTDFLKQVDVLALCSVMENLPYCILEAMERACPVVATRVGGLPDLVEDGVSGFLVGLNDAEEMAERIQWLAEDPEERFSMGDQARAKLQRDFNPEKNLQAHEKLYASLFS